MRGVRMMGRAASLTGRIANGPRPATVTAALRECCATLLQMIEAGLAAQGPEPLTPAELVGYCPPRSASQRTLQWQLKSSGSTLSLAWRDTRDHQNEGQFICSSKVNSVRFIPFLNSASRLRSHHLILLRPLKFQRKVRNQGGRSLSFSAA
jgi:hypothetical protein